MSSLDYIESIKEYLKRQFSLGEAQIDGMLPDFISTLKSHMETIEQDVGRGDIQALGKSAHTMKGALVNLGLSECADLAIQVEEGGKGNDATVDYEGLSKELRNTVDKICQSWEDR